MEDIPRLKDLVANLLKCRNKAKQPGNYVFRTRFIHLKSWEYNKHNKQNCLLYKQKRKIYINI